MTAYEQNKLISLLQSFRISGTQSRLNSLLVAPYPPPLAKILQSIFPDARFQRKILTATETYLVLSLVNDLYVKIISS